jgi:hypothetical protein
VSSQWCRVVILPGDAAVEDEPNSVVVEVAESLAGPFDLLDQQVGRFSGSVGDAAGVEVGQQYLPPGVDGAGQSA